MISFAWLGGSGYVALFTAGSYAMTVNGVARTCSEGSPSLTRGNATSADSGGPEGRLGKKGVWWLVSFFPGAAFVPSRPFAAT